jgi:hypothetical protein
MNRPNFKSKDESSKARGFGATWMALTETSVPNDRFVSTAP